MVPKFDFLIQCLILKCGIVFAQRQSATGVRNSVPNTAAVVAVLSGGTGVLLQVRLRDTYSFLALTYQPLLCLQYVLSLCAEVLVGGYTMMMLPWLRVEFVSCART